ncbi:hypothetical protein BWD121_002480 [Bartonella sp. WD12.1]|nr:hypothetical protein BWD121_002480 [Bartonella sp. WD12.1]
MGFLMLLFLASHYKICKGYNVRGYWMLQKSLEYLYEGNIPKNGDTRIILSKLV